MINYLKVDIITKYLFYFNFESQKLPAFLLENCEAGVPHNVVRSSCFAIGLLSRNLQESSAFCESNIKLWYNRVYNLLFEIYYLIFVICYLLCVTFFLYLLLCLWHVPMF